MLTMTDPIQPKGMFAFPEHNRLDGTVLVFFWNQTKEYAHKQNYFVYNIWQL